MKSLDVQIVITSENFTQRGTGSGQENSKGTNGTSPASPQGLPTAGHGARLAVVCVDPPSQRGQAEHPRHPSSPPWSGDRSARSVGLAPRPGPGSRPRSRAALWWAAFLSRRPVSTRQTSCLGSTSRAGPCWVSSGAWGVRALFTQGSGELGDSPLFPRSNPRVLGLRGALQGGAGPSSRSGVSYPGPGATGLCEVVGAERGWRGAVAPVADARPHARFPPQ